MMEAPVDSELIERLLALRPEERRRLIARVPAREAEVHALAERARATAQADPVESLRVAEVAGELAEPLGGRARALALRARAVALRAQARWPEALEAFRTGAQAAEEASDSLLAAQIPIAATEALAQMGRYDEALRLAADLERRLGSLGASEDAAKVLANSGNIHFQRSAYAPALECWRRALEYFEGAGQEVPAARLRMNVANVLVHLGRVPEAVALYQETRRTLEAAGMGALVAGVEGNLGFLHYLTGAYTDSLQSFRRAREQFQALALRKDVAQCDREMGDVYRALNLGPEAREAYEQVLPVFEELGLRLEAARARIGLAATRAAAGETEPALDLLALAEAVFRGERNAAALADIRLRRAGWLRAAGRGTEARREAGSAARSFSRQGLVLAAAEARLALLELRLEAGERPVRALRRLARETQEGHFLPLRWRAEAGLARALDAAGSPGGALRRYRRAVDAIEEARALLPGEDFKIAFVQDKLRVYEALVRLLLDRGTSAALAEPFRVPQRSRSRALLDLLAGPAAERGPSWRPSASSASWWCASRCR